jgi:hypothetical protein
VISVSPGATTDLLIKDLYDSNEFQSAFSSIDNSTYVDRIYQRILARPADSAGKNFYLGLLNSAQITRLGIYLDLIKSPEFQSVFSPIKSTNDAAPFLYKRILSRTTTQIEMDEGSGWWMGSLNVTRSGGTSLTKELPQHFANSTEFKNLFFKQDLSAKDTVRLAYKFFLQREPEDLGLTFWINELVKKAGNKSVYTQKDFVNILAPHFVSSSEFISNNPWYNNSTAIYDY